MLLFLLLFLFVTFFWVLCFVLFVTFFKIFCFFLDIFLLFLLRFFVIFSSFFAGHEVMKVFKMQLFFSITDACIFLSLCSQIPKGWSQSYSSKYRYLYSSFIHWRMQLSSCISKHRYLYICCIVGCSKSRLHAARMQRRIRHPSLNTFRRTFAMQEICVWGHSCEQRRDGV